jgi:hypothetical protein
MVHSLALAFSGTIVIKSIFNSLLINVKLGSTAIAHYSYFPIGLMLAITGKTTESYCSSVVQLIGIGIKDFATSLANSFVAMLRKFGSSTVIVTLTRTIFRLGLFCRKFNATIFANPLFYHDSIISKTTVKVKKKVYNLEVDSDNTFFAENVLVHNCPACIALHGTEVPVGESLRDHFNGRCDAIYVPIGGDMPEYMQTFGKPGERNFVPFQTGEDWFAGLPEAQQKQMLGPGKFEWYQKTGELSGLIGTHEDSLFGEMPVVKPLKDLQD